MIICSRCKTENEDGVKFCRECGNDLITNVDAPANDELKSLADSLNEQAVHTEKQSFNLNKAISEVQKKLWSGIKKSIFFRKKKNTIITCSSLVVIILLIIGVLNSGYIAFTMAYNMGKYDAAKNIQGWSFNSNFVKTSIEKFVISKMDDYYNDFSAEKITYDEATENFKTASDFCTNKDAKNKTEKLQTSRTAFLKAEEYEKSGDIYNATVEYLKVIEEDKTYNTAKERIEKNKPAVKQKAIIDMDACVAVNDFNNGLKIVSDMEKIFTNDSDINNYKKDFQSRKDEYQKQQKINELRNTIRVSRVFTGRPNSASGVDLYMVWTNTSDKTIKYCDITVQPYNSVGDVVECTIRDRSYFTGRCTGPYSKGQGMSTSRYWDCAWYNSTISSAKITEISIEYMDGTKKNISGTDLQYVQY